MTIMIMDLELPCKDHGKTTSLSPDGYALVAIPGVSSRCVGLHRLVYAQSRSVTLVSIGGKVVRHRCDNTRCIDPSHLVLGTIADNNRDRAERNRSAKIVPSRHALTKHQAQCIQARYNPKRDKLNGVTALAREFGVDTNVIYNIVEGTHACLL